MQSAGEDNASAAVNYNSNDSYNDSSSSSASCPLGGSDPFTPFLASVQLLIALAALLGNGAILWLIWRQPSLQQSANNLFVAALALSDLLVAINIPFYISFYFEVIYAF